VADPIAVTTNVYVLDLGLSNAYLWDRGERLTLIDTGIAGSDQAVLAALRSLGRSRVEVDEIVLTHFHDDHRGAAAALADHTGATVIAHEADAPVIAGEAPQPPPNLTEEERPFAERVIPQVPPAPPVRAARTVRDGDELAGGAVVVHVPGHTPGSIAILVPALRVLFTGDTIASFEGAPVLGPFNLDRELAKESVRRQAALDFDVACFGHGAPLAGGASARIVDLAARL
jgi:glyoxylase-like metal-dependent hydrolase (beta-lactamase superfamily II)